MDFTAGMMWDPAAAAQASELIPDGLIAADADARIIYFNRRATLITRLSPEELLGHDIRERVTLQDSDGSSWWETTDPWGGLRIRTGHRERLLMLGNGREVLVTAKYPPRAQPAGEQGRRPDAGRRAPAAHRGQPRRADLDRGPRAALPADVRQGVLLDAAAPLGAVHRRAEAPHDRDHRGGRGPGHPADQRAPRRLPHRLRPASDPAPAINVPAVFERHVERAVATGHERERFVLEVPDELPEVWADPDRLDQILANLVENALRHGEGSVTLAAQPALEGAGENGGRRPLEGCVDLVVSDDGKGIDPAHRDLVFSRFWHGSGRGSTGLGLYVVKGLVEAHGGRILVESAPSGGAQFRFSLPRRPTTSPEASPEAGGLGGCRAAPDGGGRPWPPGCPSGGAPSDTGLPGGERWRHAGGMAVRTQRFTAPSDAASTLR